MSNKPKVSVIINCYNGERYLAEAIDSVYAQTYPNWEIVFWDNASTDRTGEIAGRYDQRLRYFRGETNIPLGAARNKALEQANADIVGFLDCDDIWLPHKLDRQVPAMLEGDYALSYAGHIEIDAEGRTIRTLLPKNHFGNMFASLLVQFDINVPASMIRKSKLARHGLRFDDRIVASEEYCLFMQLAVHQPFCAVNEPLAKWRIHSQSLTGKAIGKWAEEREYTLDKIKKDNPGIEERYPSEFAQAYARAHYYRARYFMSQSDRKAARDELKKSLSVGGKYTLLYCLLLFPSAVWNFLHWDKIKIALTRFLRVSRYAN